MFDELVSSTKSQYPSLLCTLGKRDDGVRWVIFERSPTTTCSPLASRNPVRNPRMVVYSESMSESGSDITFKSEAHFTTLHSGVASDSIFTSLLQSLLLDSSYHLCTGLSDTVASKITFDVKNALKWSTPFNRTDHVNCKMWFPTSAKKNLCEPCTKLTYYVAKRLKSKKSVPAHVRDKRADPSSHCPIKYLSPKSKQLRATRKKKKVSAMRETIDNYRNRDYDVNVNDITHKLHLCLISKTNQRLI